MLNPYYIRSHISARKFRELAALFIRRAKITHAAEELKLEPKTVRDIFGKIRRRLEEDCWRRIQPHHPGILRNSFPFQVVHPAVRYKGFQMRKDVSGFAAGVVALFFNDKTIAANILMVKSRRLYFRKFPLDKPGDFDKKGVMRYLSNCGFADLLFTSRGCLIYDKKNPEKDHAQTFWLFARLHTSQTDRRNSDKFYFHLKEIEWRFNRLTEQEKDDMISHLKTITPGIKSKRSRKPGNRKTKDPKITAINDKLTLKLLELLEKYPLEPLNSESEKALYL